MEIEQQHEWEQQAEAMMEADRVYGLMCACACACACACSCCLRPQQQRQQQHSAQPGFDTHAQGGDQDMLAQLPEAAVGNQSTHLAALRPHSSSAAVLAAPAAGSSSFNSASSVTTTSSSTLQSLPAAQNPGMTAQGASCCTSHNGGSSCTSNAASSTRYEECDTPCCEQAACCSAASSSNRQTMGLEAGATKGVPPRPSAAVPAVSSLPADSQQVTAIPVSRKASGRDAMGTLHQAATTSHADCCTACGNGIADCEASDGAKPHAAGASRDNSIEFPGLLLCYSVHVGASSSSSSSGGSSRKDRGNSSSSCGGCQASSCSS